MSSKLKLTGTGGGDTILQGNDSITTDQTFTLPDNGGEIATAPAGGSVVGYQQGTWTVGSNTTIIISAGTWVRVGNKVTAFIRVDHGTNSGVSTALFDGLPYPADVSVPGEVGRSVGYLGYSNNGSSLGMLGTNNDGYAFNIRALDSAGGNLTISQCNGLLFRGALEYITNDTTWTPINGATLS